MPNVNAMSRIAMSPAELIMGIGPSRTESMTITPHDDPLSVPNQSQCAQSGLV
jgi:hypothetical protein